MAVNEWLCPACALVAVPYGKTCPHKQEAVWCCENLAKAVNAVQTASCIRTFVEGGGVVETHGLALLAEQGDDDG